MDYCPLNASTIFFESKFFIQAGSFTWYLPNALASLWLVQGLPLLSEFDLYTIQGSSRFLANFLHSYDQILEDFPYLEELLDQDGIASQFSKSIFPEGNQNIINLPAIFFYLYLCRKDLMSIFNLKSFDGVLLYLFWVREHGYKSFFKSKIVESCLEQIPLSVFIEKNQILTLIEQGYIPMNFDETMYVKSNPDVGQAIELGQFLSGEQHWRLYGLKETRKARWTINWELLKQQDSPKKQAFAKLRQKKEGIERLMQSDPIISLLA